MRPGKKFATVVLPAVLCVLTLLVAACGPATSGPTGPSSSAAPAKAAQDKQVYIYPYSGLRQLTTLDPALITDLYSAQAVIMVYNGLIGLDDKGNIEAGLAKSWESSSDAKTWTFHLRDDAKFSDGTPVTSEDVVFSINRSLDPATQSQYAPYYLGNILDVDKLQAKKISTLIGDSLLAPDKSTVVIKVSKPAAYFLYSISFQTSYVVEKAAVMKYGNDFVKHLDTMGGGGPWLVKEYTPGKQISFVPNPHWYGPKPQLRMVVRPFFEKDDTTIKAFEAGQVDWSTVPIAEIEKAKTFPNKQFQITPWLANGYYTFNYLVKPFDNIKVRQAFALAIDKEAIVHNIYKDAYIASNHIVPEGMPGYNPNLLGPAGVKSPKGDPALAKKLFDEGIKEDGFNSISELPKFNIEVATQGKAAYRNELAAEQEMWKNNLGIDVKFSDVDFNKLVEDVNNTINNTRVMAWGIGWIADYPDPQDWTSVQFAKGSGQNGENYGITPAQQEVQKLLDQADVNLNATERIKQYQDAEQKLVDDVAWMTMYQQTILRVRKTCVVGVVDTAFDVIPPEDWANIYVSTATPCSTNSQYK